MKFALFFRFFDSWYIIKYLLTETSGTLDSLGPTKHTVSLGLSVKYSITAKFRGKYCKIGILIIAMQSLFISCHSQITLVYGCLINFHVKTVLQYIN